MADALVLGASGETRAGSSPASTRFDGNLRIEDDMETLEQLTTKVKVLKEEPCEVTLSIELTKDEVAKETETVFKDIQKRAVLSGFRAGKAPLDMVKQNFADRARQTVLENLIARAATQVLREKKIQSIDTPKVEKVEFEFGKPLVFHMKVEKDPEVKAKDYKGIKVTRPDDKIKDADVEKTIHDIQDRNATLVASTATEVGKTHFVTIDFEGKIDGKTFPGGSSTNYLLDMDQPQTIAGFSEAACSAPKWTRSATSRSPSRPTMAARNGPASRRPSM